MGAQKSPQPTEPDRDRKRDRRKKARPSWLRRLIWVFGGLLLLIFGLLGILHLGPVQRILFDSQVLPRLESATGLRFAVDGFSFNLFGASAELHGVTVSTPDGQRILGLRDLHARIPLSSLFGTPAIDLDIGAPELWLALDENGRWNVPLLDAGATDPAPPADPDTPLELPDIQIRKLLVRDARLHFRRADFALDTEPFGLEANLQLARLQGGADLNFRGIGLVLGGQEIPIQSLVIDLKSAEDAAQLELDAKAPGLDLSARLALGSLRRFDGLSGHLELALRPGSLPAGIVPAGIEGALRLRADLQGSPLRPQIEIHLQGETAGATVDAKASLAPDGGLLGDVSVEAFAARLPEALVAGAPSAGRVLLTAKLSGTMTDPRAAVEMDATQLAWSSSPLRPEARLKAVFQGQGLQIQELAITEGPTSLRVEGSLGLDLKGAVDLVLEAPALARYSGLAGAELEGALRLDGRVTGDLLRPEAELRLALTGGRYAGQDLGADGRLRLQKGELSIEALRLQAAGGSVQLDGEVQLARLLEGVQEADARLRLSALRYQEVDLGEISSRVQLGPAELRFDALAEALALAAKGSFEFDTGALDVRVEGKDVPLAVIGRLAGLPGVSGLAQVDVALGGTAAKPGLDGMIQLERLQVPQADATVSARVELQMPGLSPAEARATLEIQQLDGGLEGLRWTLAKSPAIVTLSPGLKLSTERLELDLGAPDRLVVHGAADLATLKGKAELELGLDLSKLGALLPVPVLGRLQAAAEVTEVGASGHAEASGLVLAGQPLGASALQFEASTPFGESVFGAAQLLGGQARLEIRSKAGAISGFAELKALDLGPWLKLLRPEEAQASGRVTARIDFEAPEPSFAAASGKLGISHFEAHAAGLDLGLERVPVHASLQPGARLSFEGEGLEIGLGGQDHLALRGHFDLDDLRGQGSASLQLDLAKLSELAGQALGGRLDAQADLAAVLAPEATTEAGKPADVFTLGGQARLEGLPLSNWLPHPTDPAAIDERTASVSASFELAGPGFDLQALRGKLNMKELSVRGSGMELVLARPGSASIAAGQFRLEPLTLTLGGKDSVTLKAEGQLVPLEARADLDGRLDLGRAGELFGVPGAGGRMELAAQAHLTQPADGAQTQPLQLGKDGAHAKLRLKQVLLGPWMQYLGLAPGVSAPAGMLDGTLDLDARGLRLEDVDAKLEVTRLELALDDLRASNRKPLRVSFDGQSARVDSFDLNLGDGDRISLEGSVLAADVAMDLKVSARLHLHRFAPWTGRRLDGTVEADLHIGGTPAAPELKGSFDAKGLGTSEMTLGSLHAEFQGATPAGLAEIEGLPFPIVTGSVSAQDMKFQDLGLKSLTADLTPGTAPDGGPRLQIRATMAGLSRGAQDLGQLEATGHLDPQGLALRIEGLQGQLEIVAALPFAPDARGSVQLDLRTLDLGPALELAELPLTLPPQGSVSATGRFDFPAREPARISGALDFTALDLDLDAVRLRLQGASRVELRGSVVELSPLHLVSELLGGEAGREGGGTLTVSGKASAESLDLHAKGLLSLAAIRPFVPVFESMEGGVDMSFDISGTPTAPQIRGTAALQGARLIYAEPRISLEKVEGLIEAEGSRLGISRLKAEVGGGLVSVTGELRLGEGNDLSADLAIQALGIRLDLDALDIDTSLDADLSYKGPVAAGLLKGQIKLLETRYTPRLSPLDLLTSLTQKTRSIGVIDIDPGVLGGEQKDQLLVAEPQLNLSISAPADSISVSSSNVQATAQAELQVVGKPSAPGVGGSVEVTDGSIDLYASKFEGLKGTIQFEQDPYDLNPRLDLSASTEKKQETIQLLIGGRALSPTLELRSSSNQPQLEVIKSLLGPGQSSGASTTDQIAGFAESKAASFASDQVSSLISVDFQLSPPPPGKVPILFSIGKQISELLFFKLYKVEAADASDILEFRFDLSEKFSLEGSRTEEQSTKLRLRFRQRFD